MPVGVVDLDNSSTTRSIIRRLDAFQTSHVVARYPSVAEARKAIQENQKKKRRITNKYQYEVDFLLHLRFPENILFVDNHRKIEL